MYPNSIFKHAYPYSDLHELNLDWIIKQTLEQNEHIKDFVNENTITLADPIEWSKLNHYNKAVIVEGPAGNSYLSLKEVPAGIEITNTEYWCKVANFNAQLSALKTYVTPQMFGAVCDGITDDTEAVKRMINSDLSKISTIYFDKNTLISDTIVIPASVNLKMDGAIILDTTSSIPALEIATDDTYPYVKNIEINVSRKEMTDWSNDNDIGVIIHNAFSCKLFIKNISNFNIGCLLKSNSGISHCIFEISNTVKNRIDLYLKAVGSDGYITENTFIGGRFTSNFGLTDEQNSKNKYAIYCESDDNVFSNNVFIKPCFQKGSSKGYGFYFDKCEANTILYCRLESCEYAGVLSATSNTNIIKLGYIYPYSYKLIDNSNGSNYISNQHTFSKDECKALVYDSGILAEYLHTINDGYNGMCNHELCVYNNANFVRVDNHPASLFRLSNDNVVFGNLVIGTNVVTNLTKHYRLISYGTDVCLLVVKCFDANNNPLDNSVTRVVGNGNLHWSTDMGGMYTTSAYGTDFEFKVIDENVHHIWVGIAAYGDSPTTIKKFEIYGNQAAISYTVQTTPKIKRSYIIPQFAPINGIGEVVYNMNSGTMASLIGWRYTDHWIEIH